MHTGIQPRQVQHDYSRHLHRHVTFDIYLPPDYESEPERHYPLLLFNDGQWLTDRYAQRSDRMRAWLSRLPQQKLVIVELGAGGSIPTVRLFGEQVMYVRDALLVRINPREPEVPADGRAVSIARGARDALSAIDAVLETLRGPAST